MADIFEDGLIDFSYSTVGGSITANITPFSHNVVTNTSNDGSTIDYTYTFAQAYIVTNSPFDSRASGLISGMSDGFSIPVDKDIEFQVKATLSKQNYKILGAEFFTGLPSEEGQNSGDFTYPIFDYISEDTGGSFQLIYPICSVRNQHVVNQTTRDNIVIDKVQFKQLGGTGASTNGEGGIVHIIQESGRQDPSLPIRFRGISGGSGVQVRYESADPTGDFYHSGDGGLIIIDSSAGGGGGVSNFVANTGDSPTGAKVYKEGTNFPQFLRSITGAEPSSDSSAQFSEVYVYEQDNQILLKGQITGLWTGENVGSTTPVYKDGTGPTANPSSNAQFRSLKSSDGSVGIGLTDSDNSIDITTDLQKTTDGGQSTTNKVGVGTDGTYVPSNFLEIYGTTKIQNRTTATDGTLQFGNQAASNITYSHINSAIEFGENITGLHFINGGTVGIGTSNSIVLGGINNQSL